jgi:hypothetical protein
MGRPKKIKIEDVVKVEAVSDVPVGVVVEECIEVVLPEGDGWITITKEQSELAEKMGVLAGYCPKTMTALINRGE